MPVTIIEHKGKKILYTNFANVWKHNETMAMLDISDRMYQEYGDNVRHLINFENSSVSQEFLDKAKEMGRRNVHACLKDAYVGITDTKAVLLRAYLFFTGGTYKARLFNDVEKAKDWLAED